MDVVVQAARRPYCDTTAPCPSTALPLKALPRSVRDSGDPRRGAPVACSGRYDDAVRNRSALRTTLVTMTRGAAAKKAASNQMNIS